MTSKNSQKCVKPFLKWAGGKRWLVSNYNDIFPDKFNRYIEPFLGGGAVFFSLQPNCALLGDSNTDLIETYQAIQSDWSLVWRYLKEHSRLHSDEYYYKVRSSTPQSPSKRAAKFIYLNRTCWNGLYRVNLKGQFNVPRGTKDSVTFPDDRFDLLAESLTSASLHNCDFEELVDKADAGDLLFVDPPYTVRHNYNAFIKYNEKLFSWEDQERLSQSLIRAHSRGVYIVGTNAHHSSLIELFSDFDLYTLNRNSPISSKASTRKSYEELLFLKEPKRV